MDKGGGFLGSKLNGPYDEAKELVRNVVYQAYCEILMELAMQDEAGADEWIRLTARGMRVSAATLIRELYKFVDDLTDDQKERGAGGSVDD